MLPEDWARKPLSACAKFVSGGTPSKDEIAYWNGQFPWVTAKDMKTLWMEKSGLGLSDAGREVASVVPAGTVLVLTRGMTLLKDLPVCIARREVAFNQDVKALIANDDIDSTFLAYQLIANKNSILDLVDTAGHGTGRLDTSLLKDFVIDVPPKSEQLRIARVLEAWGGAIAVTERLLANSRKQRQIVIEGLISGSKHANFSHGLMTSLGEVTSVTVSSVNKKHQDGERSVRLCNYTDVYYNESITSSLAFMEATASDSEIAKFSVRYGDVLITKDSETPSDIAISAYVAEDIPNLVCGYHLAIIRPDTARVDPVFLHSYFALRCTRAYFASQANGATRFGLPVGAIQGALIWLPDIQKQRRISQIVTTITDEIICLQRDLDALKVQKHALMQQLLGGRRRLRLYGSAKAACA